MFARRLTKNATFLLRVATILVLMAIAPSLFAQAQPITIAKSFSPSTVTIGGTSTTQMTVTITNPNAFAISGINFSDTYPAGLVPDVVGAYTCSAGSALFNGSGWAFNNVTLGAGASCSVPMFMHATVLGQIVNTTSQLTGTGVPASGPATATLTVIARPLSAPALSEWMLALLVLALAALSIVRIKA
jgi:hypothetical protein